MPHVSPPPGSSSPDHPLTHILDELAPLLPAQGPISIFIHHNTLHALEHLPFEDAVEQAAARLGCEPFLSEARYRDKLGSGRILSRDVESVLREHLGERGSDDIAQAGSRFDFWRAVVLHGIPSARGNELSWILHETPVVLRFRRLWNACVDAAGRANPPKTSAPKGPVRLRDWLRAGHGLDTDTWFHPSLIHFLAGYLDQGLAHWAMPDRARGIHGCFLELYRSGIARQCGPWARTLPVLVEEDRTAARNATASIEHSLEQLGVRSDEWTEYLGAELLALRGWAGIVRQIEERPDRVPARDLTVTLRGYLAVRLLLERSALEEARRQIDFRGSLSDWRAALRAQASATREPSTIEWAWQLFHVAQLCGLDVSIAE